MLTEYPDNWKEIVSKVKQRDLMRCVLCGSNKRLEVHHTREKPLPENLITLCYQCHKSFANSYCGFKKKIREFNDLRLNKNSTQEEIFNAHNKLIGEINARLQRIRELKIMIKKQQNKTLDKF